MVSPHLEQHFCITTLCGQMNIVAYVMVGCDRLDHWVGEVFWVGRGETETHLGEAFGAGLEQLGEAVAWDVPEFECLGEALCVFVVCCCLYL